MPALKDDELNKVNGGVTIGTEGWSLVIDLVANPDYTVEQAIIDNMAKIQAFGLVDLLNTVQQTIANHKDVTKVVVTLTGSVTYYIGATSYTQQQIDNLPVQQ